MSNYQDILNLFFSRSFEKDVEKLLLDDKEYIVPRQGIYNYIRKVVSVPYSEFLAYLKTQTICDYSSNDITQCSSIEACEIEMCNALLWKNNPGLQFEEIGQLFPKYVTKNTKSAFVKYGENQIKTSAQLGLVFEYYDYWYLSAVGYVFPELSDVDKQSLLARTILRTPFYQRLVLDLCDKTIYLTNYMKGLSKSTCIRRSISTCKLLSICAIECQRENIPINGIYYDINNGKVKYKIPSLKLPKYIPFEEEHRIAAQDEICNLETRNLDTYINFFNNLHTATIKGKPAPYKAILLLTIIDFIDNGTIHSNVFQLIPAFKYRFDFLLKYYVGFDNKVSISMPLVHMSSEPFWNNIVIMDGALPKDGMTYEVLMDTIDKVSIDGTLFDLLHSPDNMKVIRETLYHKYLLEYHKVKHWIAI